MQPDKEKEIMREEIEAKLDYKWSGKLFALDGSTGVYVDVTDIILSKLTLAKEEGDKKWRDKIRKWRIMNYHNRDCPYMSKGCNCGFLEREIYNKAVDDLLELN